MVKKNMTALASFMRRSSFCGDLFGARVPDHAEEQAREEKCYAIARRECLERLRQCIRNNTSRKRAGDDAPNN